MNQAIEINTLLYPTKEFLFDIIGLKSKSIKEQQKLIQRKNIIETSEKFNLQNRRYIWNKFKLIDWIFWIINDECKWNSFADIFAWTWIIWSIASKNFNKIIINDFLDSNYAIYQAFFSNEFYDKNKINHIIKEYNSINSNRIENNYFSENFWWKYFSHNTAKLIWYIREDIEKNKDNLTNKEYYILIASLLYSIDKIANTVWHYDAFFKKDNLEDKFFMKSIDPLFINDIEIFKQDTNILAKNICADIVYIDPPYNSRQYSRFYHILENLTKWEKPELYWTALKPAPEKISEYCKVSAKYKFAELVNDLNAKYLVVSYNNTYKSKSNSSKNKMTLEEIKSILETKWKTKIFEQDYKSFNAWNTDFDNHKEYLFVTKVNGW